MKNYWPLGIFLLAMVVVGLIVLTLKVAISNPVELQGMCQQNSQYIDENANAIAQMRTRLLRQYNIAFESIQDRNLNNFRQIFLRISDKIDEKIITEAKVEFFLTRPNTTKEDKTLGNGELVDGLWQSKYFEIQKQGRYQSEALVTIGDDSICVTQEYLIKE
ncbi:hypothetical protein LS70_007790 [Helicobacter sp. MIT 11-5569]|uniref:hypothetical protein n=1 Tax=Helicobacter sp. MIT 11-5569 TaxID=1548151 RepID=UPI00051FCFC5|nr:hypothetical protein [Helicobacter sp. MIT 11-5569]TLD81405.1 hypothetical protein LS70_007790 [Helicobacter sp. MIT 11-5569]